MRHGTVIGLNMRSGYVAQFPSYGNGVIQSREELNRMRYMLDHIRGVNGVDVTVDLNGGILIDGTEAINAASNLERFLITRVDSNTVKVNFGIWTRNGNPIDMTVDAGKDYKTLALGSVPNETFYIYVLLGSTTSYDAGLVPDTLVTFFDTNAPSTWEANSMRNVRQLIGIVTTDSNGGITSLTQTWLGDIDDTNFIGDTNNANTSFQSIEINHDNTSAYYLSGQLFEFDNPSVAPTLTTDDTVLVRDDSEGDLVYADASNLVNNYGIGAAVGTYLNTNGYYWIQGDSGDQSCYGESIGNDSKDIVIDLDGQKLMDGANTAIVDWGNHFVNGASWTVTDTTAATTSSQIGAWIVRGGVTAKKGVHGEKTTGTFAGLFQDDATVGNEYALFGCNGSLLASFYSFSTGGRIDFGDGTYMMNVDGDVNVQSSGDYYHNGNQGWTGTFQVTQGGVAKDCKVSGGIIYDVS